MDQIDTSRISLFITLMLTTLLNSSKISDGFVKHCCIFSTHGKVEEGL